MMSILDEEIDLIENTDYSKLGFPSVNDIKERNDFYIITCKYYEWVNKPLFNQYKFMTHDQGDDYYHLESLEATIRKDMIDDSYILKLGVRASYICKESGLISGLAGTTLHKYFYTNYSIKSKSEHRLFKEAYRMLEFFKDHIDCIETFITILNYDYLNSYKEQYVLVDKNGKIVFVPDHFKNALDFIEFICTCKLRDIKLYRQFEYVAKFNIPWVC